MIMDPVYGYESVNVEAQSRSLASLLSWTKRLISVRKSSCVFGRGSLTFIRPANRAVLVYVRQYQNEVLLCVANMSRSAQAAEIDLSPWRGRVPLELLGRKIFPPIGDKPYVVTLAPYGFFWFQLCERDRSADRGAEHRAGVRDAGRHRATGRRWHRAAPAIRSSATCCRPFSPADAGSPSGAAGRSPRKVATGDPARAAAIPGSRLR